MVIWNCNNISQMYCFTVFFKSNKCSLGENMSLFSENIQKSSQAKCLNSPVYIYLYSKMIFCFITFFSVHFKCACVLSGTSFLPLKKTVNRVPTVNARQIGTLMLSRARSCRILWVSESTGHISITAMLAMQTMPEQMWPGITENSASFRVGFS